MDPQFSSVPEKFWLPYLPALPVLEIIQTRSYAAYFTIAQLRPLRKPPYWFYSKNCHSSIVSNIEKCCYLVALVRGSTGTKPIPFSVNMKPTCIDSSASVTVSNNKDVFVDFQPIKDINLSGIATSLPISANGAIKWPILTDSGTEVELYIREALYVPPCLMNLLSPQNPWPSKTKQSNDGFNILTNIGIL